MKFGRELKQTNNMTEKQAIQELSEHLRFLQRMLEQYLSQLEKKG